MKRIFILSLFFIIITAYNTIYAQDDYNNVTISQNGKTFQLTEKNKLVLERTSFIIEFDLQYNVNNANEWTILQVAATSNAIHKKYFKKGDISKDNPYFSAGTGFAGGKNEEYFAMIINGGGHHFIFYKNDDFKRATIIQKKSDELIRFKWTVDTFFINDEKVKIEDSSIKKLYLMILIDENDNDIIEEGEY